jgi:nucleotide-binding universal stress UspA family protein
MSWFCRILGVYACLVTFAGILCPVDRSPVSRRAFDYAVSLARWTGSRLTVLEVIDVTPPVSSTPIREMLFVPEEIREGVRAELGELIGPALAVGVGADVRIEEGRAAERILHVACDTAADLIVLGTHGRSGVERLVLGSVAEKIVRQADCPVLTVPPGAAQEPSATAPFHTVLCPTDFSEASAAAVALASDLAGRANARLLFLHVVDWPFGHTTGPDPVTTLRESLLAEAGRQLAPLVPAAPGLASVETIALAGHPGRQIVAVARDRSADLIVMGVSGRGAIDLAVLGSTTHRVLREACCPVLTVRPPGADGHGRRSHRSS